ncbi:hypothetical protein [Dyella sp. 2HG41-7]|uniref:hypothetical protein n=1 Tax=Dyella sp. 2HG41-7 TaxID=2883239 RepID=UPI001F1C89D4|nr:hypothetical protein [Dyella sp. 2HG41-7]
MTKLSQKQYERRVLIAMGMYTAYMLLAWPLVRATNSVAVKCLLALVPVLPMIYVIAMLARRIRASDELERYTHLIGLGIATAVVGVLSLVGGFLSIAGVMKVDGSVLIWVFPVLMLSYGLARWRVTRSYGGSLSCESESALPKYARFLLAGVTVLLLAWLSRSSLDALRLGILCGAGGCFLVFGAVYGVIYWRRGPKGERGDE